MKKTTTVLSIISLSFSVFAVLLAVSLLTFLWRPAIMFLNTPAQLINYPPIIPMDRMISIFGYLLVTVLLFIGLLAKRSFAIEIIAIVLLSVVIPFLAYITNIAQMHQLAGLAEFDMLSIRGITSSIILFPSYIASISCVINYVSCGMRIAEKVLLKNRFTY